MSEKYRLVLHTAARLRFVEENGLAHSDFDFARYLACRLGHALGELVEVQTQCLVSQKFGGLRRFNAIDARRLQERRRWVVSIPILRPFGPRRFRPHAGPGPDLDPARSRVVVLLAGRRPLRTEHAVVSLVTDGLRDVHRDVRDTREVTVNPARLLRALRRSGRRHDASARCGGREGFTWA